jgi:hypothetical protein
VIKEIKIIKKHRKREKMWKSIFNPNFPPKKKIGYHKFGGKHTN